MRFSALLGVSILVAGAGPAFGGESEEALTPEFAARRLWSIIQVVQEQHVQPPAREALLKAVLEATGHGVEFGPRLPTVTDEKSWGALLQDCWRREQKADKTVVPVIVALLGSPRGPGPFNTAFALL